MKNKLRKLIREEIDKLFETLSFQSAASEQLAMNMALFKLPRKGIDDSINNYNLVHFQLEKEKPEDEKIEDNFSSAEPELNNKSATVSTNIFEDVTNPMSMQKTLDWSRPKAKNPASLGDETEDEIENFNDNIDRELTINKFPPGKARDGGVSNNKTTPWE